MRVNWERDGKGLQGTKSKRPAGELELLVFLESRFKPPSSNHDYARCPSFSKIAILAKPRGSLRPCSHSCNVRGDMPNSSAALGRDSFNLLRQAEMTAAKGFCFILPRSMREQRRFVKISRPKETLYEGFHCLQGSASSLTR